MPSKMTAEQYAMVSAYDVTAVDALHKVVAQVSESAVTAAKWRVWRTDAVEWAAAASRLLPQP